MYSLILYMKESALFNLRQSLILQQSIVLSHLLSAEFPPKRTGKWAVHDEHSIKDFVSQWSQNGQEVSRIWTSSLASMY